MMFGALAPQNQAAPVRDVLGDLDKDWIQAGCGFARSSIAGDEEVPTEFLFRPSQGADPENDFSLFVGQESRQPNSGTEDDAGPMIGWGKVKEAPYSQGDHRCCCQQLRHDPMVRISEMNIPATKVKGMRMTERSSPPVFAFGLEGDPSRSI